MQKQAIMIGHIPALLWGPATGKLFIAVHGDQASKTDPVIEVFAQAATAAGWQVLSFDLPQHGGRTDGIPCMARECVEELQAVLVHAQTLAATISVFGCSVGACFSLLAYAGAGLESAVFLSPVVDMQRLIENMMGWFNITPARLKAEGEIETPAKTLYWDYYSYVCGHPADRWEIPTRILVGEKDELSEFDVVQGFCAANNCGLSVMPGGEHWFHTPTQLAFFGNWLQTALREG